jgi:4-hydroxy-tetrahydrodipicolinate reductase
MVRAAPNLEIGRVDDPTFHANKIAMHAIRGGGVYGEHQIRLIAESEEIELSHRALSRDLFAAGALVMASWLVDRKPGVYHLH